MIQATTKPPTGERAINEGGEPPRPPAVPPPAGFDKEAVKAEGDEEEEEEDDEEEDTEEEEDEWESDSPPTPIIIGEGGRDDGLRCVGPVPPGQKSRSLPDKYMAVSVIPMNAKEVWPEGNDSVPWRKQLAASALLSVLPAPPPPPHTARRAAKSGRRRPAYTLVQFIKSILTADAVKRQRVKWCTSSFHPHAALLPPWSNACWKKEVTLRTAPPPLLRRTGEGRRSTAWEESTTTTGMTAHRSTSIGEVTMSAVMPGKAALSDAEAKIEADAEAARDEEAEAEAEAAAEAAEEEADGSPVLTKGSIMDSSGYTPTQRRANAAIQSRRYVEHMEPISTSAPTSDKLRFRDFAWIFEWVFGRSSIPTNCDRRGPGWNGV